MGWCNSAGVGHNPGGEFFLNRAIKHAPVEVGAVTPAVRIIEANQPRRVMVALANPQHETDLLRLGRYLAHGSGNRWVRTGHPPGECAHADTP